MSAFFPLLIFGFFIAIAVFAYVFGEKQKNQRKEAFSNYASKLRMKFTENDTNNRLLESLAYFRVFGRGRSKKIRNILERGDSSSLHTRVFDYHYTIGSGDDSKTFKQTVICFTLDHIEFPLFRLRPENFGDRVGKFFGKRDIDFSENKIFSDAYNLSGPDEGAIRKLFTKETLDHFHRNKHWFIEGNASTIVLYKSNIRKQPEEIVDYLKQALKAVSVLGIQEREQSLL